MKSAVLGLLLVVAIATVLVEGYVNQTRVVGYVGFGDRLIARDFALKTAKSGRVQVYNYKYPGFLQRGQLITCLKVIDKWMNGTNGDLYINSGGVGSTSVSLSLRSKLGYGLQYDIELYGH